jgi:hypothetical protein
LFFLYKQFAPLILWASNLKPPCSNYATNSLEFLREGQFFLAGCAQTINTHTAWITASIGSPLFEIAAMLRGNDRTPSDGQCNNEATFYILS